MSAGNLLESFLSMMVAERGAAQNTIENYQRDLEQFLTFVPKNNMADITDEDIYQFVQKLSRMNYAPKSIARKISALKEFFKFLFSEKEIKENPTAYLMAPKQEKPLPKFLTEAELKRLTDAALKKEGLSGRRLAVMLILMSACGLRVSELVVRIGRNIKFHRRIGIVQRDVSVRARAVRRPALINEPVGMHDLVLDDARAGVLDPEDVRCIRGGRLVCDLAILQRNVEIGKIRFPLLPRDMRGGRALCLR